MTTCSCWNVARDGHQVDCGWAREQRRIRQLVEESPVLSSIEHWGSVMAWRSSGFAGWTEPELRLAFGDR